uniref:Uncharacterized protein n=1 Tax=Arundo donax TaxID=35708 RepID=A0A0A9CPJ4_ARUDO
MFETTSVSMVLSMLCEFHLKRGACSVLLASCTQVQ